MDPQVVTPDSQEQPEAPVPQPTEHTPEVHHSAKHAHRFIVGYLFLIVLVAAVGATYAWQHNMLNKQHKSDLSYQAILMKDLKIAANMSSDKVLSSDNKTWTDSKVYSLSYPSSWTVGEMAGDDSTIGSSPTITFTPDGLPSIALPVYLNIFTSSDLKSIMAQNIPSGSTDSPKSLSIDGYPALYYQSKVTPTSTPGSLGYTDDFYVLTDSSTNTSLQFEFQESQTGSTKSETYDATKFVPTYDSLVKSVKFLQNNE